MSNSYHFTGRLADDPQMGQGENAPCRFRLIRNEYTGSDSSGKPRPERQVVIPFAAFGGRGKTIHEHARKGDQLIIDARIENNRFTDSSNVERFDYNFIVEEFDFGARADRSRDGGAKD